MKIKLTEEIWKEGNMYVFFCPELDISSCGKNIFEAKKNLSEAIRINVDETKKMGTFEQFLSEAGFFKDENDTLISRKELVGFTPIEVFINGKN